MSGGVSNPFVLVCLGLSIALAGCAGPLQGTGRPGAAVAPATRTEASPVGVAAPPPLVSSGRTDNQSNLRPVDWIDLPDWGDDDLTEAWPAWLQSCKVLGRDPAWREVCERSLSVDGRDRNAVRDFFQRNFQPHEVANGDATPWGLVTGYFEPIIRGDRIRTERARYPIYGLPSDLIAVELADVYPELKSMRLRGRLVGNRLVPYYTREQIVNGADGFRGEAIAWAEDPVDLFNLQIQGSGRIQLPDGKQLRIGYAGQNGHPFRSVARILIERGELRASDASMQAIKRWGERNPDKLSELLNMNPSYVFFRVLPDELPGPLGTLGVPLTEGRSAAVDPRFIPLGAPVFLATTYPLSDRPLNRLMMAHDTGGAIKGPVRVDFFWGVGEEAGAQAGRMKQSGRKWLLLPRESAR